jgi:RNA polymerase sigma-70 factor, ECF subfamily
VTSRSLSPPATDPAAHDAPQGETANGGFRELFDANIRLVWRSLLALGVGTADVGDASQQVFVVLHSKLASWNRDGSLRAFMYGICLRVASDYRRLAHRRRERLVAEVPDAASSESTPEENAASRQERRFLEAALDKLTPAQREVFILFEIEELDMTEVAQAVGCPLFTAYSRLRAARKTISAAISAKVGDLHARKSQ